MSLHVLPACTSVNVWDSAGTGVADGRIFFLKKKIIYLLCIHYSVYVYACRPEEGTPDLITDGCEPPCGCWELNSGPLEEQAMLLTSEPSLQPWEKDFWNRNLHVPVFR